MTTVFDRPAEAISTPPLNFEELVAEITACSDLGPETVRGLLWQQAVGPGNVELEAVRFGVTPHVYDEKMERLYRESYGFIFETLLYGQRPGRRGWNAAALSRIERHARAANVPVPELKILMFGDGCGEDSLFLAKHGCRVDYFDLPGSRTFEFASRRFAHHGVLDRGVRVCVDIDALATRTYDVVISFEVLEHLTQPRAAIRSIARLLKDGGIALVSDAFGCVNQAFPTHLACNFPFRDTTPFLFLESNLVLKWSNRADPGKPMEFRKLRASMPVRIAALLRSRTTMSAGLTLLGRSFSSSLRPVRRTGH